MAINSITNVNPYAVDRRANIQAAQSAGQSIGSGIEALGDIKSKAEARKQADEDRVFKNEERHRDLLDREQRRDTETFGELNQATSNSGAIGRQFQQLAADDKAAFVELTSKLQDSSTSKEERSEIREQMGMIGNRAKTIASGLSKLNENAASWDKIRTTNGISDATPPAARDFMMDLINRENEDRYEIYTDENGKEKFKGTTSNGHEIDFFVDDVANGTNVFRAIPKANKEDILDGIRKEVPDQLKTIDNAYGLAQQNDTEAMGQQAGKVIMERLNNEDQYRSLASVYGFGYEELQGLDEGIRVGTIPGLEQEDIDQFDEDNDGSINSQDELKGYLANRMLQDLSDRIPNNFKQINSTKYTHTLNQQTADAKQAKADNKAKEAAQNKAQGVVAQVGKLRQIGQSGDLGYLDQFKGQKTDAGAIIDIQQDPKKKGSVAINTGTEKTPKWITYDLTNQNDVTALQSTLSGGSPGDVGQAYATTDERVNSFLIE